MAIFMTLEASAAAAATCAIIAAVDVVAMATDILPRNILRAEEWAAPASASLTDEDTGLQHRVTALQVNSTQLSTAKVAMLTLAGFLVAYNRRALQLKLKQL